MRTFQPSVESTQTNLKEEKLKPEQKNKWAKRVSRWVKKGKKWVKKGNKWAKKGNKWE
jgi:hypothetical protein